MRKRTIRVLEYCKKVETKNKLKVIHKLWEKIKFIFISTLKLGVNLANAGVNASMRPIKIVVGIIGFLIFILPIAVILAILWDCFIECLL